MSIEFKSNELKTLEDLLIRLTEYRDKYNSIADEYYFDKSCESYDEWKFYSGMVNGIDSCQRAVVELMCNIGQKDVVRKIKWQ